jgi:large subunit ribosomal protein L3
MQDATHGNSISHRAIGSTGQCQDPGRVFKGKKMPGQLGNVQRTIQNLTIVKIMSEENIMLVKGSVPGHKGSVVIIKPTQKKYTPKEIYSETDSMKASPITDEGSSDEAQIVDEVAKKESSEQSDKE